MTQTERPPMISGRGWTCRAHSGQVALRLLSAELIRRRQPDAAHRWGRLAPLCRAPRRNSVMLAFPSRTARVARPPQSARHAGLRRRRRGMIRVRLTRSRRPLGAPEPRNASPCSACRSGDRRCGPLRLGQVLPIGPSSSHLPGRQAGGRWHGSVLCERNYCTETWSTGVAGQSRVVDRAQYPSVRGGLQGFSTMLFALPVGNGHGWLRATPIPARTPARKHPETPASLVPTLAA